MLYKSLLKPVLFRMQPEDAHHFTMNAMKLGAKIPGALPLMNAMYGVPAHDALATNLWGIHFPNPVGLAAGLDKDAVAIPGFSSIGFGFIEVGTVTPVAQPGNDKPRLFRLPEDLALVNRMGFNNKGAEAMRATLEQTTKRTIPIAVNIGKNKITPNERAEEDYRKCVRALYAYADLFVVNISSPNTPNLRSLQHGEELKRLLAAVMDERDILGNMEKERKGTEPKPVLVKIAPDLTDGELEQVTETIMGSGVSGIIATNTTISRDGLTNVNAKETGGLSGKPLTARSTEVVRKLYSLTEGALPIVGSGGIFTAQDAYDRIRAGASLVEVYTALIYEGPGINRKLNRGLLELLERDGFTRLSQAVGADHK
ncbi:quinone-dependent dihydroorotate dehydrogenase [Gorillibacterium massiliense]|uniref:quinone-dependent dihydroorotate dehydrogenase n=1 Tax=Gorillibacterium massiliense TaxID=1280390 RepID=UPI0004AC8DC9|nr:quinone-dependent dihydroorotate dehydrogenase [Gorillibacterium massiliense]